MVNYDCPAHSKDYIHRVERTARAGCSGNSMLLFTQYDIEYMQRSENVLERKLDLCSHDPEEVNILRERVDEKGRAVTNRLKEEEKLKEGEGSRKLSASIVGEGADDLDTVDMPAIAQLFKGSVDLPIVYVMAHHYMWDSEPQMSVILEARSLKT
ncbi:atp-dependent rrna helicase rrp3 [Moniliophthora roreri]|nr:atp-dependent rrna helicase rrp3 [Moniliophthora roreri]